MRTTVKILDLADYTAGTAPLFFENMAGERYCASLTAAELIYLRARLESICAKIPAVEKPLS